MREQNNYTYILEQAQHLVVSSIVRNEEANVSISKHSSNSDQTGTTTRHNADILPSVPEMSVCAPTIEKRTH